jgi:hypothetical protein
MSLADITNLIIEFEEGNLDREETINLFQQLVDTRLAWQLQGAYGRIASTLIDEGLITA